MSRLSPGLPEGKYQGWGKINDGAEYAGVSPRTFRSWLKQGHKHSRLPSGRILIKFEDIDDFLDQFEVREPNNSQKLDDLVDEIVGKFK